MELEYQKNKLIIYFNLLSSKIIIFQSYIIRKFGGTGLGLFITKKIIKSMNGWIKANSKIGKYTSFIFAFPVVKSK